ncbi:MAG: hypothetical protein WD030_09250 [Pirellulales bacterium]
MEINRNQYFMIGIVLVLLGLQFRLVDRFILNQPVSQFIAEKKMKVQQGQQQPAPFTASTHNFMTSAGMVPNQVVVLPEWLGYALMSIGAVLILHSLAMPKPSG